MNAGGGCWSIVLALAVAAAGGAYAQSAERFRCGGDTEQKVWQLWDGTASALLRKTFVEDGLEAQGDTYALYDLQVTMHNLVSMAARCGRRDRLLEFARIVNTTYDKLIAMPRGGMGWICRGGRVCKGSSPLRDTEVVLTTSQYMALAMRLASALAVDGGTSDAARDYVRRSARVAVSHLNRWARSPQSSRMVDRLAATPAMTRDGASKWFFTDVDLWMITIYAELAGLFEAMPELQSDIGEELTAAARDNVSALMQLFAARLTLAAITSPRLGAGSVTVADIDRGFWRNYSDNRYAGYTGSQPPVACGGAGGEAARASVKAGDVPVVESGGWDFSHARRLVHAIDALERNRAAMISVYRLPAQRVAPSLGEAFAAALVARVWNGDSVRPLFSNYWDGSNGWYRAGYAGGNAPCNEGYPPSALSDSFATGGFAAWSRYRPELGALGRQIFGLAASKDEGDVAFVGRYYAGLGEGGTASARTLARLMFWPSLVARAGQ